MCIDRCPVCSSDISKRIAPYRYSHPIFERAWRCECTACGMVFASPMPSSSAVQNYNSSYFENAHGGLSSARIPLAFFSAIARLRVSHVQTFLRREGQDVKRILEIGPGKGDFARIWLSRNPGTEYFALESDVTCHEILGKMGVQVVSLPDIKRQAGGFDLVVMSHVLEHVVDPVEVLGDVYSVLRRGGVVFAEVPCLDFAFKPVDEPHVLFFDKKSLWYLLKRTGFNKILLSYHGQRIEDLKSSKPFSRLVSRFRNRLIRIGISSPFSSLERGLENVDDDFERAVIKPFLAHVEQSVPSAWLRALAIRE
jgi:SAM-dependent methyltransferase